MTEWWQNFVSDFTRAFITDDRWKYLTRGLANTLLITLFAVVIGIAHRLYCGHYPRNAR